MNRKKNLTDPFILRRERMVEKLYQSGIRHEAVLQAMFQVPRHQFVDEALAYGAYDNVSLPIGLGQTISQPYIVAKMTELLISGEQGIPKKVLEIGTGCGYQTSILASLSIPKIYSIERLQTLYELAKKNVQKMGLSKNVHLFCTDGYCGLPEKAPFEAIIVTAAPKEVPGKLVDQLAIGGRLVIPLGEEKEQYLWLIERQEHGFLESCIDRVRFVPLVNSKV